MTLDEAIERELYRVEANRDMADSFHTDENIYSKEEEAFRNREDYHSQIAEWLRELKALRENDDVKDVFKDCNTCKYLSLDPDDYPCDRCCHRYINQYVYDDKREVNADDYSKHS